MAYRSRESSRKLASWKRPCYGCRVIERSGQSYSYASREGIHSVSWEEFYALCAGLAIAVADYDPDVIVGVARGGLYPATQLSHLLRLSLVPVVLSRRVNDEVVHGSPVWTVQPPASLTGKRVLVIDEICDSGETLRMVVAYITETALTVRSAVLYSHTRGVEVPDYVGLVSDELIINPWDKSVVRDGKLVPHPEYVEALRLQQLGPAKLNNTIEPVQPDKVPGGPAR
jgi:hypoxanthine phosphoribosyltransferase